MPDEFQPAVWTGDFVDGAHERFCAQLLAEASRDLEKRRKDEEGKERLKEAAD